MSRYTTEPGRELPIDSARLQTTGSSSGRIGDTSSRVELASIIDQAAEGRPTLGQFFERLERGGVTPIPSLNVRGLNGMSYRFRGSNIKGSDIGRAYTARGLQDRKGITYAPERDAVALRSAIERAGNARPDVLFQGERQLDCRSLRVRDPRTGLNADQWVTLNEIGKFRTVGVRDLIEHRYAGRVGQFDQDIRVLREAGLAERRTAVHTKSGKKYEVVVLTAKGRMAARRAAVREGLAQEFYAGLVKSAEIRHDIGIYRMFLQERAEIEAAGGRVTRVVMDFEVKKQLMSDLNKRGEDPRDQSRKAAIADRHDIRIVSGRFVIPDLRVEYQTLDGSDERVDLELATGDYKPGQIAAKQEAGLKIYGPDSTTGGTPWEPEYAAALISL
jgi:DNA-binding MarR family transcriptional regulator